LWRWLKLKGVTQYNMGFGFLAVTFAHKAGCFGWLKNSLDKEETVLK
jgi:hypothetical protein